MQWWKYQVEVPELKNVDLAKVCAAHKRCCSRCGHAQQGVIIRDGFLCCRHCGHATWGGKGAAPRRVPAWRPAVIHGQATSTPRPRERESAAPRGRDGESARDDGGGGDDGDGEPPGAAPARGRAPSINGRRA